MSLDILIPHYRDLDGLAQSLASVGKQTWTGDMRVVVVDDGSPTTEFRAVEALVNELPFPSVIERNVENRGRPYTRNRLLDSVDNDYVAWLDAGDVWYPDKISYQFEHLNRLRFAGADVARTWVTCDYDWHQDGGSCRRVEQDVGGDQLRELFLGKKLRAYLWTLLAPASTLRAIGRFDEGLPRLQDLDYFIRFVKAGGVITNVPHRQALCRYHKSDLGRSAREIRGCNKKIFRKYQPILEQRGRKFVCAVRFNAETLSARYAKNNGDAMGRIYYISRAFAAHPMLAFGMALRWASQLGR